MIPEERIQMDLNQAEKEMFNYERSLSYLRKPTYVSCKRIQINCSQSKVYEKISLRKRIIVENNPFLPKNIVLIGKQRFTIRDDKYNSPSFEYICKCFSNIKMSKLHPLLNAIQDIIGKKILEKTITQKQLIKIFNGIDL